MADKRNAYVGSSRKNIVIRVTSPRLVYLFGVVAAALLTWGAFSLPKNNVDPSAPKPPQPQNTQPVQQPAPPPVPVDQTTKPSEKALPIVGGKVQRPLNTLSEVPMELIPQNRDWVADYFGRDISQAFINGAANGVLDSVDFGCEIGNFPKNVGRYVVYRESGMRLGAKHGKSGAQGSVQILPKVVEEYVGDYGEEIKERIRKLSPLRGEILDLILPHIKCVYPIIEKEEIDPATGKTITIKVKSDQKTIVKSSKAYKEAWEKAPKEVKQNVSSDLTVAVRGLRDWTIKSDPNNGKMRGALACAIIFKDLENKTNQFIADCENAGIQAPVRGEGVEVLIHNFGFTGAKRIWTAYLDNPNGKMVNVVTYLREDGKPAGPKTIEIWREKLEQNGPIPEDLPVGTFIEIHKIFAQEAVKTCSLLDEAMEGGLTVKEAAKVVRAKYKEAREKFAPPAPKAPKKLQQVAALRPS